MPSQVSLSTAKNNLHQGLPGAAVHLMISPGIPHWGQATNQSFGEKFNGLSAPAPTQVMSVLNTASYALSLFSSSLAPTRNCRHCIKELSELYIFFPFSFLIQMRFMFESDFRERFKVNSFFIQMGSLILHFSLRKIPLLGVFWQPWLYLHWLMSCFRHT